MSCGLFEGHILQIPHHRLSLSVSPILPNDKCLSPMGGESFFCRKGFSFTQSFLSASPMHKKTIRVVDRVKLVGRVSVIPDRWLFILWCRQIVALTGHEANVNHTRLHAKEIARYLRATLKGNLACQELSCL